MHARTNSHHSCFEGSGVDTGSFYISQREREIEIDRQRPTDRQTDRAQASWVGRNFTKVPEEWTAASKDCQLSRLIKSDLFCFRNVTCLCCCETIFFVTTAQEIQYLAVKQKKKTRPGIHSSRGRKAGWGRGGMR